ncbi:(+)-neomenthol dehydrogenase [Tripterygium wilfordii]|uniref:(+)-neomenthol dehydrogenase n=1 Tax=Tripterygium wilfordii TaxID=458696 RepID=UPI0018F83B3A|nr:(+)-neomenthol dehydrogenase [Tripterygium wilfordii]
MEVKGQEILLSSPPLSTRRWWSSETVAVVTGANKGIGFAMVKRFAELGLSVVLSARDKERGHRALDLLRSQGLNNHVHFFQLDISNPSSITTFASWFKHNFQALDILVNNAGVSFNEIHENSVENAESVIKTNFYGSKMLTQALLPLFRPSSPISFSSCRILNISSRLGSINELRNPKLKEMLQSEKLTMDEVEGMVGLFLENVKDGTWKTQGWPEIWPDYAVSKMALNGYSRVLAKLYKDKGLCVNCFCPGFTQTSMTGGKGTHTADDAAAVAAGLALIPAKDMQTGRFYLGFHRPGKNITNSKL